MTTPPITPSAMPSTPPTPPTWPQGAVTPGGPTSGWPLATLAALVPLLLLLVLVLGAALIVALSWRDARNLRVEHTTAELEDIARQVAAGQARLMEASLQVMMAVSAQPALLAGDWTECKDYLGRLARRDVAFGALNVLDADAIIRCSSVRQTPAMSLADRSYIQQALARPGQLSPGVFQIGRVLNTPVLPMARALPEDQRRPDGAVVIGLALPLTRLQAQLGQVTLPEAMAMHLIDREGVVLASVGQTRHMPGSRLDEEAENDLLAAMRRGRFGLMDSDHRGSHAHLHALFPVTVNGQTAAYVAGTVSRAEAAAISPWTLVRQLAGLGLGVLLVLALASALAWRWLLQPMLALRADVQAVGRERSPVPGVALPTPVREVHDMHRALMDTAADLARQRSERDHAQAEADAAREGMLEIVDRMDDGFLVLDMLGHTAFANRRARELLRMAPDDARAADFWAMFHGRTGQRMREQALAEIRAQRPWTWEDFVPSLDRWLEIRMYPSADSLGVFLRDNSERWQMLRQLRERERRYRELFELNPRAMVVIDTQTLGVLAANAAAQTLYGYAEDEWSGLRVADLITPEDRDTLGSGLAALQSPGGAQASSIWRHITSDGQTLVVELTLHALNWDGRPACVVMVTPMGEQLDEMARLRGQFEALLAERERLQHHIQVLRSIERGTTQVVERDIRPVVQAIAEQRADSDGVLRAAREALALIDEVTRISTAGQHTLAPQRLDLSALAHDVAARLADEGLPRATELSIEPDLRVHGDELLVRLLLQVLVTNAVEATEGQPQARLWLRRVSDDELLADAERPTPPSGPVTPSTPAVPVFEVGDSGAHHGSDRAAGRLMQAFAPAVHAVDARALRIASARVAARRHGGRLWAVTPPSGSGLALRFTLGGHAVDALRSANLSAPGAHG